MANRRTYFYRQRVTEAELNAGFQGLEDADRSLATDYGILGVVAGLGVVQAAVPNLTVDVAAGSAYDQQGRRVRVPSTQNLSLATDFNAVSTTVAGVGNEKWLSVFVRFGRNLSDPRVDGNAVTVYFVQDETFQFYVTQGSEAAVGLATRPALESDKILLCDIRRTNGVSTILNAEISTTRRQDLIVSQFSGQEVRRNTPQGGVQGLLELLMDHVNGTSGALKQAAASVNYAGGPAWNDAGTNPAATVEAQLDKLISDLAGTTGGDKVGMVKYTGTYVLAGQPTGSIQDVVYDLCAYIEYDHRLVTPGAYPYSILAEGYVLVDTSSARTLTLPAPAHGRCVTIKDAAGLAQTNNITLNRNGSEQIEGIAAARTLGTNWGSWTFIANGTNWFMV